MTQRKVLVIDNGHQAFDELATTDHPAGTVVGTQQAHIIDGAVDAATDATTNLSTSVSIPLITDAPGVINTTNTAYNALATKYNALAGKYNALAAKVNLIFDALEAYGILAQS